MMATNAEAVTELGGRWEFSDPRRDDTAIPYTDADTVGVVDGAVDLLVVFRCPLGLGDAGAVLSCLVSLIAEADGRLADAVADARDQGYGWDDIAARLAIGVATARRRYGAYCRWRASGAVERGRAAAGSPRHGEGVAGW